MTEETNGLKPCPHCGGKAEIKPMSNFGVTMYGAGCTDENCTATITGCRTPELAADAWNQRAPRSEPLQHPHGIFVMRCCTLRLHAMEGIKDFLTRVGEDTGPSALVLEPLVAEGCSPQDAEIVYYSFTAGRSIALGRDPVLEAIERGDVKMRVQRESVPDKCALCDGEIDGSDIIHADPGDGECTAFCSMPCVERARVYLASLPKRESSVTIEEEADDA